MLEIIQTNPAASATGVYLNQSITVQFNKHIKGAYLTDEYIKLYRVYEEAGQEKYQQTNIIISAIADNSILIKPVINLLEDAKYTLLIRGDVNISDGVPSGILADDDDVLDGNYLLSFTTGTELTPEEEEIVPTYDVSVDDDIQVSPTDDTSLRVLDTSVKDMSYGIESMDTFDITFSEQVELTSIKAVSVTTRNLDPRFIERVDLQPENVVVSGDVALVSFEGHVCISGMILSKSEECNELPYNHEYEVMINKEYIKGKTTGAVLKQSESIQFSSLLIPMYAVPYDIRETGLGYIGDNVPDYVIAKMIHANSKYIARHYDINYYSSETVNAKTYDKMVNYVICKTTYDLLRSPLVSSSSFGGRIGSKSLGDFSISYDYGPKTQPPVAELKEELAGCFEAALQVDIASVGVKSKDDQYYPGRRRDMHRIKPEILKRKPDDTDILKKESS